METKIFSCSQLSEKLLEKTATEAQQFAQRHKRKVCLAVILVGNDAASEIYVKKKSATCHSYGIEAKDFRLDPSAGFASLVSLVETLNADPAVDGILVQSPLPKDWSEATIQALIHPLKDVDGFHPENMGRLTLNAKLALEQSLVPCTPAGVMEVLAANNISLTNKQALVIGRSNIVGKPMALMLLAHDATVTIAHSKTKDLQGLCKEADLIVAAMGKAEFIDDSYLKPGVILIDVGINRKMEEGKQRLCGDINRKKVTGIAALLTPVPFGIGPMTIALLLRNTVRAAKLRASLNQK